MIDSSTYERFSSFLAGVQRRIQNIQPALVAVAEMYRTSIEENSRKRGRYSSSDLFGGGEQKWQKLAKSTKKQYKKRGYTLVPTLNRSGGGLYASLEVRVESSALVLGSNKPYAAVHQFGGKHTPARPFVVLQEADFDETELLIAEYLQQQLAE